MADPELFSSIDLSNVEYYFNIKLSKEDDDNINNAIKAINMLNSIYKTIDDDIKPLINRIDHNFTYTPSHIMCEIFKMKDEVGKYIGGVLSEAVLKHLEVDD